METPVSRLGIRCVNASFPLVRPEEAIEVRALIGMADEPIYFLVHEVDENLAAALDQNLLDLAEGSAIPSERINEKAKVGTRRPLRTKLG